MQLHVIKIKQNTMIMFDKVLARLAVFYSVFFIKQISSLGAGACARIFQQKTFIRQNGANTFLPCLPEDKLQLLGIMIKL